MVSSTVLLTAGHCIAEVGFGQQITMYHGDTIDDTRRRQASHWKVHPSYCPDCRDEWFDIAYVVLTLPYEPGEAGNSYALPLATQAAWDELMVEGQPLQIVGYGSNQGSESGARSKRVAEARLTDLAESGRELQAKPSNGITQEGDSGGPYFATRADGVQWLVGIHSRSTGRADTVVATTPYPSLCWLRDETGVDLLPLETGDCSSIDIEAKGCRLSADAAPGLGSMLLGLLMAMTRRRSK